MRLVLIPRRALLGMAALLLVPLVVLVWMVGRTGPPPIMLDPGHGGIDGGANREGLLEKEITLDVALRTRRHLQGLGVPVQMTREQDQDLGGPAGGGRHRRDLAERVRRTRECGAAVLVSLHVNSARNPAERGMLFFYQRGDSEGERLARAVAAALASLHGRKEPPIPRENLYLLRNCQIPAVLVEMGFLTNPADRALLADPAYRERVALALALALKGYYAEWQARETAPGRPYTARPRHIY